MTRGPASFYLSSSVKRKYVDKLIVVSENVILFLGFVAIIRLSIYLILKLITPSL